MIQVVSMQRLCYHLPGETKSFHNFYSILVYSICVIILCQRAVFLIGQLYFVLFLISFIKENIVNIYYIDVCFHFLSLLSRFKRRRNLVSRHCNTSFQIRFVVFIIRCFFFYPRVSKYFRDRNSIAWIQNQHSLNQVFCFWSDFNWKCIFTSLNYFVKLFHVWSFKWYSTLKHSIQNNSQAPNVCKETFIALISYDFRSNISWSSTLLFYKLMFLNYFGYSKIA